MIILGNADPEGQGYCQAGFSLDFYKVNFFGLLASNIYLICLIFILPLPLTPTPNPYPPRNHHHQKKLYLASFDNFNFYCLLFIYIKVIYAHDNLLKLYKSTYNEK